MKKKGKKESWLSIGGCILGCSVIPSLNIDKVISIDDNYEFKNMNSSNNAVKKVNQSLNLNSNLNKSAYVTIPDPELKKAFNKSLGRTNLDSDLTISDMEEIRDVKWVNGKITNIEGVQYAINMHTFDIYGNNVSDLTPLKNHPKLQVLYLNKNPVEDVAPISTIPSLDHLRLDDTFVSDLSSLKSLNGLWTLRISDTKVTNFDFLENLTELKELHIEGLNLNDLSMLEVLPQLEHLQFHDNNVVDISPVAKMTNLKTLSMNSNNVSTLDDIRYLTSLETLEIGGNPIGNITPLENLPNLKKLIMYSIGSDNLDITPLANKEKLEILQMNANGITDITALSKSTNLKELNIEDNDIVDVSALRNMTKMEKLDMSKNSIEDISALSIMIDLIELQIDSNNIDNIESLANLVNIVELRMQKNNITDISAISGLIEMVDLKMGYNKVRDISALNNLIKIEELEIYENSVLDLSPLKNLKKLKVLRVERQKGTLDELIANSAYVSTPIPFRDIDNQPVELSGIGEGGYQLNGKIYYDNIPVNSSFTSKLVFDKQIDINGTLYRFNGDFNLPIRTLDNTVPTVTVTHIPDGWTNKSITLVISARDEYSGIKSIKLPDGNIIYSDYAEYIVHENDIYEIEVEDKEGNIYKINHEVNSIDRKEPNVELVVESLDWTNNTGIIRVNAYDEDNGSRIKELILPNGIVINEVDENKGIVYRFAGEIGKEYKFKGVDVAGNYSESKIMLDNDKRPPVLGLYNEVDNWTNDKVTLRVETWDNYGESGIEKIKLPSGEFIYSNGKERIDYEFDVFENGEYTVTAYDNIGNQASSTINVINIDKELPTLSVSTGEYDELIDTVELTIKAYDSAYGSGIAYIKLPNGEVVKEIQEDFSIVVNKSYPVGEKFEFECMDNAGNKSFVVHTIDDYYINIPDENLRRAINIELNKGNVTAKIKKKEIELLTAITADNFNIESLEGLNYAVNLKGLYLPNNKIVEIEPIKDIVGLQKIDFSNNKISNIECIENLTNIMDLNFTSNNIVDINALRNMRNLKYVWLGSNKINDISSLNNKSVIKKLDLTSNNLDNFNNIEGLTDLVYLSIENNRISDISSIRDMNSLEDAWLGNNNISEISSLRGKSKLKKLNISNNKIQNIDALKDSLLLNYINMGWNNISDISVLKDKTLLKDILAGGNCISDITPLEKLTNLSRLNIESNNIYDLTVVEKLSNLTSVQLDSQKGDLPVVEAEGYPHRVINPIKDNIGNAVNLNYISNDGRQEGGFIYIDRLSSGMNNVNIRFSQEVLINSKQVVYSGEFNLPVRFFKEISVDITGNPSKWINTNATLKLNVTDSKNIVNKIVLPDGNMTTQKEVNFNVTSNGEYSFKIIDIYGEEIIESVHVTKIDKDLPKMDYSVIMSGEKERRIKVMAYDELSGVDGMMDAEGNRLANIDTIEFDVSDNGNYFVVAIDKANNMGILNINIDDIINDSNSGIEKIEYKLNGENNWIRYLEEIKFSHEGIYTLYAKATDKAGNESHIEQTALKIDKSKPSVVYTAKYNEEKTNAEVTVVGTDDLSGVKHFVGEDGNIYNSSTYTFNVSKNGIYLTTAYDNAGNISIVPIEISGLNGETTSSGVQKIEYKLEGSINQDWSIYKSPIALIQEGTTVVIARSYDNAGNISDEAKLEVKIDKTKPHENRIFVKPIY